MIHRKLKREYARVIRELSDDVLAYVSEEVDRERKRRRLGVRARRAAKRVKFAAGECAG